MLERGRTESVREQFEATAKPMADLYVLPTATRATVPSPAPPLDWSIEHILSRPVQQRPS